MKAWQKIPVIVRALFVGTLVSAIGHQPPGVLYLANLKIRPAIPWSVPFVVAYLWFFWQYAQGRWWPRSTAEARRRDLRARPLSPEVWRWSLIAGGLWMSSVGALHYVLAYVERPRFDGFYRLFEMNIPPVTLIAILVVASAVAGIVEEAAFRGYMQTPIERRYGPALAILVVSAVFVLVHFGDINIPMSATRVFFILAASVNYGLLTHFSGSILPGMVLHSAGDAFGVGLLWLFWMVAGRPASTSAVGLSAAAADPTFWLYCAEALILGAASAWGFVKLANAGSLHGPQAAPSGATDRP
ncbi:MAG TPA: CPBP family intramembrane glutamic endopeptidase [Thermoanaerobaculia bacterium]|nr:CPBP family intramembrane glutamic endopeptidase [Thermoanaerobaculia bacterium]